MATWIAPDDEEALPPPPQEIEAIRQNPTAAAARLRRVPVVRLTDRSIRLDLLFPLRREAIDKK
jgi:hypothetical protein